MREGWHETSIGNIARVVRGASPRPKGDPRYYGGSIPRLMVADVTRDGRHVTPQIDYLTEEGAKRSRPMPKGTLTIVCSGDVGRPSFLAVDACIHDGFLALEQIDKSIEPEFLFEVIKQLRGRLERSATHGGIYTNLTTAILREFRFSFPPLPEQRKIAKVLRTWDDASEKLTALRNAKVKRLTGLRDKLLFGTLNSGKKESNWPSRRLSEVTHEVTSRNGHMSLGRELVMGVTNRRGIVPMREQTVAGDIARYKHLPPQAFAYNPMRINVGSIAKNEAAETVLVSPDYVVFGCNPDGIEPDYLDHLRKTAWWAHYINSGGSGSVRQRTYYADLAALRLPLPDIAEQREIVAILNAAKADLSSTEEMIEAVKLQKRGLMQKLLTGEWRVASIT